MIYVTIERNIGIAISPCPISGIVTPVAVHFVEWAEEHRMTEACHIFGVGMKKSIVLTIQNIIDSTFFTDRVIELGLKGELGDGALLPNGV